MALYKDIASEIERRIGAGVYKPGEKIPSIRKLAQDFGCNKLTVQKAFEKLRQDGFLENIVGSGSFVRFPEKISRSGEMFDFRTDYLSESFFPYQKAKAIFSGLFDTEKSHAFAPAPAEGDPELMRILGEYYRVPTRRMLVISGSQQGLDLISKVFSAQIADAVLFEDPTYPGVISLFRARRFVPLMPDGPDLKQLDERLDAPVRLFYTMPSVHNPTGISYSLEKKQAIAERARRYPFYIIEDDYLSDFQDPPVPRFVDLVPERTIYIKSLAQTTVSGIRLGFMVVPEDVYEKFTYTKFSSDIASSGLLQKFVKAFIRDGDYSTYISQTRLRMDERRTQMLRLIARYPELSVPHSGSGYSLWVRSGIPVSLSQVPWTCGENFSFSPEFRNFFRLSFMHMDDPVFVRALDYLKEIFDRISPRS